MENRASLTPDVIITAAVAFVDQHGVEALTLRSLGQAIGAHHTALYRHFDSKESLLEAMYIRVLDQTVATLANDSLPPIEHIRSVALAFRRALHEHPALVSVMVSTPNATASYAIQNSIVAGLRDLGVPEVELAKTYQALESFVLGATAFDFTDAPNHLEERKKRFAGSSEPIFRELTSSADQIDRHNEAAFVFGLELMLAGIGKQ